MTKRHQPKDFYRVIWWDAQDLGGSWADESTVHEFSQEPCEIISYGFLVTKNKAYVALAADFATANGDYGRVTKIPTPWVRKMSKV